MQDKIWVDGMRVYKPDERAPQFVKVNVVLHRGRPDGLACNSD
jgi:hypothetical protein